MKPVLPQICSRYEVRNPVFHLPDIRHSFGHSLLGHSMSDHPPKKKIKTAPP